MNLNKENPFSPNLRLTPINFLSYPSLQREKSVFCIVCNSVFSINFNFLKSIKLLLLI